MTWQKEAMREQERRQSKIIAITATFICALLLCSCGSDPGSSDSYHAEGIENYNKDVIIEKYAGDLDSDLSVFPDEILTDKTEYSADFKPNLFDTDGKNDSCMCLWRRTVF